MIVLGVGQTGLVRLMAGERRARPGGVPASGPARPAGAPPSATRRPEGLT